MPGVILPFPGGIVRSGSKVGSRYKTLRASTNDEYCPTLRGQGPSRLPMSVHAVYEIVIDGLDVAAVEAAMRAASGPRAARGSCRSAPATMAASSASIPLHLHKILDS